MGLVKSSPSCTVSLNVLTPAVHCTLQHQTMSPTWSWSLLGTFLLLAMAEPQDFPIECCTHKTVGSVSYTLLPEPFHGELPHQCKNKCIYTVSGTSSQKFCFKTGVLPTECLSDTQENGVPGFGSGALPFSGGNGTGLLEARYEYVQVLNEATDTLENVTQQASTLNDFLLIISQNYPQPYNGSTRITICDKQSGSSTHMQPIKSTTLEQIVHSSCGFILWDENSSASCSDLQCKDAALSTFVIWNLTWCPEAMQATIGGLAYLPQCCYNTITRPKEMDLFDCLQEYWIYEQSGSGAQYSFTGGNGTVLTQQLCTPYQNLAFSF